MNFTGKIFRYVEKSLPSLFSQFEEDNLLVSVCVCCYVKKRLIG